MSEDIAGAETTDASRPHPYHWFQGESVRALYDRLTEYGPDVARLEVHQRDEHMLFRVAGDEGDPINNSHLCPPQCG